MGTYGHPDLNTPNIDNLAKTGIKFTRAYTTCPLCTPARAGIFTGIYPHTAGAWTNNLPLGDNIKTMGQRFQDGDYRTAYVGKWHMGNDDSRRPGFDYWVSMKGQGSSYDPQINEDGERSVCNDSFRQFWIFSI